MKMNELKALVAKGESEKLEFKKTTAQLNTALETVCAFLNGKGGIVLIGVTNEGKIIGQDVTDNTRKEIANYIAKLEPPAQVKIKIDYIPIDKTKKIIVIRVSAGTHVPYVYDCRPFLRNQSTTTRMPQHRYEQLIVERGQLNHKWEDHIASGYSINDLDKEEIYKTVADGIHEGRIPASAQKESISKILERLNLVANGKLKQAAVVLYAQQDALKFMHCMIKMARFKGKDKLGEFIDNQQFCGNAFQILNITDIFLRRHLPIASSFKPDQFKRIDKPTLPIMAIREAIINAIVHRDYADFYTDIALAIFDDRLEIWNSGDLLQKLTVESLKHSHSSILRNKLIANAFYVRGLIEKWGTGTNKMIDLCKRESLPEPEFNDFCGGLMVTFRFKETIEPAPKDKIQQIKLKPRQQAVLAIIEKNGSVNIQHIIENLEYPVPQRTAQADLASLKKLGLVKSKGKGKATVWVLNS